jgi:hypothetical protein
LPETGGRKRMNPLPATTESATPASRRDLILALVATAITILVAVSGDSLWVDEGSSVYKAMRPSLSEWWRALLWEGNSNMQLPLYLIALWVWEKIFGSGEWIMRMANAPFFLLTVYGLWLAFREDRIRFRFSVLFLLTNAFVWFYLNEARPYLLLLAGGTLLFAAVYRLKRNPAQFDAAWAWLFTLAALLVCAASMIAAPWTTCAFCAAWYVRGKRFPLEFARLFPAAFVTLAVGMTGIGGYYLWSLKAGAGVPGLGATGLANLAFAGYEMFGFAGLGPARIVMRVEFLRAFHGYYLPLFLYGAVWGMATLWFLWKRPRPFSRRTAVFHLILLSSVVAVMLIGYVKGARILPRYLTTALPLIICFGSYLASVLWRSGPLARGLVVCLFLGGLISSLELRFAPRHAKEDYRAATAAAKAAVAEGKRVYWGADVQTGLCYGLVPDEQRVSGSAQVALYSATDALKTLPGTDVIVISRPDIYDPTGEARDFVRTNSYQPAGKFHAFEFWQPPGAKR